MATDDQATKSMPPSGGSSVPSPEPASFQLGGRAVRRESSAPTAWAVAAAFAKSPVLKVPIDEADHARSWLTDNGYSHFLV